MQSIFSSSKRWHFHSRADKHLIIELFQKRFSKPSFMERLKASFGAPRFLGTVNDNRLIRIERVTNVRNSFRPQIFIELEPGHTGTTVTAHFEVSLAARAFLVVWIILAAAIAVVSCIANPRILPFVILFPVWGVFLLAVCRLFARADEKALGELVEGVMAEVNAMAIGPSKPTPANDEKSPTIDVSVRQTDIESR